MTPEITPFDHRPDPVLGPALRHALMPGDDPAFVSRVMARVATAPMAYWDVLASWARAGIAAALVAAMLAGVLVGRTMLTQTSVGDVVVAGAGHSGILWVSAPQPPDPSAVLASADE